MKLKKNDLQELMKVDKKALVAKLDAAKLELGQSQQDNHAPNKKAVNLRATKITKRTIAQLNTLIGKIKE